MQKDTSAILGNSGLLLQLYTLELISKLSAGNPLHAGRYKGAAEVDVANPTVHVSY